MRTFFSFTTFFICIFVFSQDDIDKMLIKSMSWGVDLRIELKLNNDSIYIYDVEKLHHANSNEQNSGFVYYPVNLNKEFADKLKVRGFEIGLDTSSIDSIDKEKMVISSNKTLWSALHGYIGGGFVHFVNTLLFTFESNALDLNSPIMMRPESTWKPKPITDSYKRTKEWNNYTPITQKEAKKEYKIKLENNELGDLKYLPQKFIELTLNTSDKELKKLRYYNKRASAQIDLVKLMLGTNYLGEMQIYYIKSMVLKALTNYNRNRLPSVIIFDDLKAAVAMNLDERGYTIERIIFKDEDSTSQDQLDIRKKTIENVIENINQVNRELFQERLKQTYN